MKPVNDGANSPDYSHHHAQACLPYHVRNLNKLYGINYYNIAQDLGFAPFPKPIPCIHNVNVQLAVLGMAKIIPS